MATLDFIVRYTQDHQASLRPHFDASTVTAVVGLNQYGKDFEGGGTHFIRQKCIVRAEKVRFLLNSEVIATCALTSCRFNVVGGNGSNVSRNSYAPT